MKIPPFTVTGQAFIGNDLTLLAVDIIIQDGIITAIEESSKTLPFWICPAFFNAHTHLGDTIAMDCGTRGDLVSLVTPPDGLKHRLLAGASHSDLVRGMRSSIMDMTAGGTAGCADFREGGAAGVSALREAGEGLLFQPFIFGRDGGENVAGGLGISSTRDIKSADKIVMAARRSGKKIAVHAGERDSEDVDDALALDPDLLIHCTHATKKQLRECSDRQIPIAVCPRSNWMLGVASSAHHPPLKMMYALGCRIFLGTDNVMFVPPDMFSELSFTYTVYKIDSRDLLRSAVQGSEIIGSSFFIHKGMRANMFTIDPEQSALHFSHDPVTSLIKRAHSCKISNNVFNL